MPEVLSLPFPTASATLRLFVPPTESETLPIDSPGSLRAHLDMTLSEFFESYVLPFCLEKKTGRNLKQYRESLSYWEQLTPNPTLRFFCLPSEDAERRAAKLVIRSELQDFVNKLQELPGRHGKKIQSATIRKHCVHLQRVIDEAGPESRRHRNAAELLNHPPYLPKPAPVKKTVEKNLTLAEISQMLQFCGAARQRKQRFPHAELWWKSIILTNYNSALRIGTLLKIQFDWLFQDELGWWVRVPSDAIKTQAADFYLNRHAMQAIEAMHTVSESSKIFTWPYREDHVQKCLERIMVAAEIPKSRRQGVKFHGLRRAFATECSKINPAAAKMALGHTGGDVTIDFYTHRSVMVSAMDKLPQPALP